VPHHARTPTQTTVALDADTGTDGVVATDALTQPAAALMPQVDVCRVDGTKEGQLMSGAFEVEEDGATPAQPLSQPRLPWCGRTCCPPTRMPWLYAVGSDASKRHWLLRALKPMLPVDLFVSLARAVLPPGDAAISPPKHGRDLFAYTFTVQVRARCSSCSHRVLRAYTLASCSCSCSLRSSSSSSSAFQRSRRPQALRTARRGPSRSNSHTTSSLESSCSLRSPRCAVAPTRVTAACVSVQQQ
jgi:hypothetical protein